MRLRILTTILASAALVTLSIAPVQADSAKSGQGMTHIKTAPGLASTLEGAGVVIYTQGGATSAVMGDSLSAANGQVVLHIPVTGVKRGVQHTGSTLVLFNTSNNKQVQLRNPVVNVAKGEVTAVIPQGTGKAVTVFEISNAGSLKAKVKRDSATGGTTTTYTGARLVIAPGIGTALDSLLGLPAGSLPDGTLFATAEVTLNAAP